jgi:hypothetical protein
MKGYSENLYEKYKKLFLGLGDGWGMKPTLTKRPEILKELGSHLLQTLDGFIFVLSADGKVTKQRKSYSSKVVKSKI